MQYVHRALCTPNGDPCVHRSSSLAALPLRLLLLQLLQLAASVTGDGAAAEVRWRGPSQQLARVVTTWGRPVVVHGAPSAQWQAAAWTPQTLPQAAPAALVPVQASSIARTFGPGCCAVQNMTLKEFVNRSENATDGPERLLLDGDMLRMDALVGQVSPLAPFVAPQSRSQPPHVRLWMATRGVVVPCRLNTAHTFLVLLHGQVRATLLPPSAWRRVGLHSKQSAFLGTTRANVSTLANRSDVVTAQLRAQEVLYVPPFWYDPARPAACSPCADRPRHRLVELEAATELPVLVSVASESSLAREARGAWAEQPFDVSGCSLHSLPLRAAYLLYRAASVLHTRRAVSLTARELLSTIARMRHSPDVTPHAAAAGVCVCACV